MYLTARVYSSRSICTLINPNHNRHNRHPHYPTNHPPLNIAHRKAQGNHLGYGFDFDIHIASAALSATHLQMVGAWG